MRRFLLPGEAAGSAATGGNSGFCQRSMAAKGQAEFDSYY
jgi:hypothetical protein